MTGSRQRLGDEKSQMEPGRLGAVLGQDTDLG